MVNSFLQTPTTGDEQAARQQIIEFDPRNLWHIIMRRKWHIASLSLVITLFTAVVVSSFTPMYRATATLLIEAKQAKVLSIEEIYGLDSSRGEYYQTQFEILKSREIAERVVDRLQLLNHPEFEPGQQKNVLGFNWRQWLPFLPQRQPINEELRKELNRRGVVNAFVSRLTISPVRRTQLVKISFASAYPDLAAEVANSVTSVYIESQLEAKMAMTEQVTSWLNDRLEVVREKLAVSERELLAFQEQEQLLDVAGVQGLATRELNELTSQLIEARNKLAQNESVYQMIGGPEVSFGELETLPEVLNHSLIQDVKKVQAQAEQKVSELSLRYGPKHPNMIAARAELATVRNNLSRRIHELITGIEREYQVAGANEQSLQVALTQAKVKYQELNRKETRYNELKREVTVNRQLYLAFLTRFKETNEISGFDAANARLTDPAIAPLAAFEPRKRRAVILALIISTLLGVMLVLLYDALLDGVSDADDVENKLGMRLIGLLPWVRLGKGEELPLRIFFDTEQQAFAEAVRSLRTNVVLGHLETDSKVICVTSSIPAEGKTTVAKNLAFALAQMESVVLIDADMRRPSLGKSFNLRPYRPGLFNLITGSASLDQCIYQDEASGIDIIPAGAVLPDPQELLSDTRFTTAIKVLRDKYDRVVIDSAPTLVVSDALIISRQVDVILYVVKADSTRRKVAVSGIGRLLQVGAKIDGVVLNHVDTEKASYYDGDYYQQDGYGNQSKGETSKKAAA